MPRLQGCPSLAWQAVHWTAKPKPPETRKLQNRKKKTPDAPTTGLSVSFICFLLQLPAPGCYEQQLSLVVMLLCMVCSRFRIVWNYFLVGTKTPRFGGLCRTCWWGVLRLYNMVSPCPWIVPTTLLWVYKYKYVPNMFPLGPQFPIQYLL